MKNISAFFVNNKYVTTAFIKLAIIIFFTSVICSGYAQTVTTVAGGAGGYGDGMVSKVEFNGTNGVAVDSLGNIYVGDRYNHRIRKISAAGVVSTFAGNGIAGFADGPGANAEFNQPTGLAIDTIGNIYVAENTNNRIRKITPAGVVSTYAGNGIAGFADGAAANAEFFAPDRLAFDKQGNLYVADFLNDRIRKITPGGIVSTYAGNGIQGYSDGSAANAEFYRPNGVALDSSGNVYVAEYKNNRVRKISISGMVSTVAGNGLTGHVDGIAANAEFNGLAGIILDKQGNIYITEQEGNDVRRISTAGDVSTFAANSIIGFVDGITATAMMNNPRDMDIDSAGNIYIADFANNSIRRISPSGNVNTVAGNGLAGYVDGIAGYVSGVTTNAEIYGPNGVAVDAQGNMYLAEWLGERIRKITPAGIVTTIAGNGIAGLINGIGINAEFNHPSDIIIDAQGNLYITEARNDCIRKITPDGTVSTLAGNGIAGFADGQGANAQFWNPNRLTFDHQGNIIVADAFNNRIRKVTPAGLVTTIAGNGNAGYLDGSSASAEFSFPNGVAIDSANSIFVADYNNNRIRKISEGGLVTTVAGNGFAGYLNGTGINSEFNHPGGICINTQGDFYISDENNNRIRKLTGAGVVSLYAGNGIAGLVDGTADSVEFNDVRGLCVDTAGNVFVPDYNNNKIRKITIGSVFPVTLLNLTAHLNDKNILLQWQTASEANTNYFIVQRSTNGTNFSEIGKVYAAGNGNNSYQFTDKTPNSGANYYRLQMVDKDGRYTYSKVLPINISLTASFIIYPNPAKDHLYVQVKREVAEKAVVQITDMQGKVLQQQTQQLTAGVTSLSFTTSALANGTYILLVKGQKTEAKIFVRE